jgi:MinD-like ATPase involved in chromosome partitioning or flagellar assembly
MQQARARSLLLVPVEAVARLAELHAHLGMAFAQVTRQPVVLVDAARQSAGVAALFGMAAAPGWEELLAGLPISQVIQQTGHGWLDVVPAGNRLACATPDVWAARAARKLQSLERHYRLLVIAAPPWPQSPHAALLAPSVAASCLVTERPLTDLDVEKACVAALHSRGHQVFGSVVMAEATEQAPGA